ncbi:acetyltransferase [Nocardioides alpinus]|uniref:Acetyltransferase n=1 Tax=Nocardioides alpinus TaxID=748909 RepID=A0A1I1A8I0_9ACTN|nr:GNAT family N-acetyltransferase [Nocardioides alpinus]PKH42111.1 N-acetyltransferase [Nocardioides alpinus]SFB32750.1 acetyltransferase [Nocardioides alpinus]
MDDGACEVRLRSGAPVWIRQVRSTDAAELQRAFALMSEESQYRRFLTGTPRLTDSQAAYFTAVDHVDHEAYVAHSPQDETYIIGVARFIRYRSDPSEAELAITVADSWHGQGLATALVQVLRERAKEVGVKRFRAEMMADNEPVLRLLRSAGLTGETVTGEMVSGHIDLGEQGPPD